MKVKTLQLPRSLFHKGFFAHLLIASDAISDGRFLWNAISDNAFPLEKQSPWRLATVKKVEEVQLIINMIPIWLCTLAFGICASQTTTFVIKQAIVFDKHIGHSFLAPPASMFCLTALIIYEKLLLPLLRRTTGLQGLQVSRHGRYLPLCIRGISSDSCSVDEPTGNSSVNTKPLNSGKFAGSPLKGYGSVVVLSRP